MVHNIIIHAEINVKSILNKIGTTQVVKKRQYISAVQKNTKINHLKSFFARFRFTESKMEKLKTLSGKIRQPTL